MTWRRIAATPAEIGRLQRAVIPGAGNGEGNARVLDAGEKPMAVRAVAGAGELSAGKAADNAIVLAIQHHRILGELEDLPVDREAMHEFLPAAVLAEHQAAARADGDVVGRVQHRGAR